MTLTAEQTDAALRTLEQTFVPERARGARPAIIAIALSGDGGGDWHLRVEDGAARVHAGAAEHAGATIKASATDFLDLLGGGLDGTRAMMTGRLRASGDLRLLIRFGEWFAL